MTAVTGRHHPQGMGASVARREDRRFLLGKGRYTDDIQLPWQSWAVFVRSPHAHAAIRGIDASRADRKSVV